jgi:hypothetical protein
MLLGNETEFGMLGGWAEGKPELIQQALLSEPHLPSAKGRGGVFLGNGARAYIDVGQNEYCTPETESPFDLVAREMVDRALMQMAADTQGVSLLCSNFDYATGNSWAITKITNAATDFPSPSIRIYLPTWSRGSSLPARGASTRDFAVCD